MKALGCTLFAFTCVCHISLCSAEELPAVRDASASTRSSATGESKKDGEVLPEVSVVILGSVDSLKGHAWPRRYDWIDKKENQPAGMTAVDTPHKLIVQLPGGRTIEHISKGSIFGQHKGIVEDVDLLPHPGQLKYQDAITLLELILKNWDAEPDERSKKLLNEWRAEGNLKPWAIAERRGWAVLNGEDKADVYFQIRPGKDGWALWLTPQATMKERRKLHGAPAVEHTTQSTTRAAQK